MSKQVLVLSASPRKGGNSDTLCDEFVRGATDAGNQAEKIFLRDHAINYCTGCGVCNSTHKCVQKDDMDRILEKMAADPDKNSLERAIDGFRGFTEDCLDNAHEKGVLYAAGVWQAGEILGTPAIKPAYDMGMNV